MYRKMSQIKSRKRKSKNQVKNKNLHINNNQSYQLWVKESNNKKKYKAQSKKTPKMWERNGRNSDKKYIQA